MDEQAYNNDIAATRPKQNGINFSQAAAPASRLSSFGLLPTFTKVSSTNLNPPKVQKSLAIQKPSFTQSPSGPTRSISSPAPQGGNHFSALPRELRIQIFSYLLNLPAPLRLVATVESSSPSGLSIRYRPDTLLGISPPVDPDEAETLRQLKILRQISKLISSEATEDFFVANEVDIMVKEKGWWGYDRRKEMPTAMLEKTAKLNIWMRRIERWEGRSVPLPVPDEILRGDLGRRMKTVGILGNDRLVAALQQIRSN